MREFLIGVGLAIFALGCYLTYGALHMDPTVSGYGDAIVANAQLMHIQMMSLLVGLFVGLAGVMIILVGILVQRAAIGRDNDE